MKKFLEFLNIFVLYYISLFNFATTILLLLYIFIIIIFNFAIYIIVIIYKTLSHNRYSKQNMIQQRNRLRNYAIGRNETEDHPLLSAAE